MAFTGLNTENQEVYYLINNNNEYNENNNNEYNNKNNIINHFIKSYKNNSLLQARINAMISEKSTIKDSIIGEDFECSICYESSNTCNNDSSTLPCNHHFHKRCIDRWFFTTKTCPLCRCDCHNFTLN